MYINVCIKVCIHNKCDLRSEKRDLRLWERFSKSERHELKLSLSIELSSMGVCIPAESKTERQHRSEDKVIEACPVLRA